MNSNNSQIQKLIAWNRFWLGFIIFCFMGCGMLVCGYFLMNQAGLPSLSVSSNGDLHFSGPDGPFIITHLITNGSELGQATAALPEPIIHLESGGVDIKREVIKSLRWRTEEGIRVRAPDSSLIKILYVRPQILPIKKFDGS